MGLVQRGRGYTLPALLRTAFGGGDETGTHLQQKAPLGLQIPDSPGGWWSIISRTVREAFTGAWQQNIEAPLSSVLQHPTVFACITLIAGDMAKMRWELTRHIGNDVWVPTENPAFSPVLRRPNHYQTDFQFRESWMLSKLIHGNTYVLKERDLRGVVTAMHVLDPCRVEPLIAPDGSVFYELKLDTLSQQPRENIILPAREIIHDRFNTFFHKLVGISPLYAAGLLGILGNKIANSSTQFFGNGSMPGGILYVPGVLDQAKADQLKTNWETNFGGGNQGRTAVIPDGMRFEPVPPAKANESQMSEQWLNAAAAVAAAFHMPFYMVGGPPPPYNNPQSQSVEYLTRCLQPHVVAVQMCLDDGLGLTPDRINGVQYGVQIKTSDLLLMDTLTMMQELREGVTAGLLSPNDGRAQLNYPPVEGGDTPYLQQQNFSLAALARRDAAGLETPVTAAPEDEVDAEDADAEEPVIEAELAAAAFESFFRKDCEALVG